MRVMAAIAAVAAGVMAFAAPASAAPAKGSAATDVAAARHQFLDRLATDPSDFDALKAFMPRPGALTALVAAPATRVLLGRLGLDASRFASHGAQGGPFVPAEEATAVAGSTAVALAALPTFLPVREVRQSSGFGHRADPFNHRGAQHQGIDMMGKHGEPIYATGSGIVTTAGRMAGYGNMVEISHGTGVDTRYAHMARLLVKPGERVRQGQVIGHMGSTGRSTGTHLHYEVRVDGRPVDPQPFLDAASFALAARTDAVWGAPAVAANAAYVPAMAAILADDTVIAGR
jgi:murein DD-endopeptidase MepM/ murein hydrolase activator NlpD